MQEKIRAQRDFLERTDAVALKLGVSLRELAPRMGLSQASLFGYRNGKIPVSRKALVKLEAIEKEAEKLRPPPEKKRVSYREMPDGLAMILKETPAPSFDLEELNREELQRRIDEVIQELQNIKQQISENRN